MANKPAKVNSELLATLIINGVEYEVVRLLSNHNKVVLVENNRASLIQFKTLEDLMAKLKKEGATVHEKNAIGM